MSGAPGAATWELPPLAAYADEPAAQVRARSQATELVEMADELDLWHADDEPYATIAVDGHRETWPLRSRAMRALLARRYYRVHRRAPGRQAIEDALAVLMGRSLHEGDARIVHTRVAAHGGAVYIDLCDPGWRAIEITPYGWRITTDIPVNFVRRRGMLPLPEPVSGGSLDLLARYVRVAEERDMRAIIGWLVGAYRPHGPYPLLVLAGEQGAGKSTVSRVLRGLIDPNVCAIRTMPRDERDLLIAARNGWVVALDNLSGAAPWLSDSLCRIATGGGLATRELYSDTDEVLIDVQRPAILNGIDAIATRPDLADRSRVVTLDPVPDNERVTEAELYEDLSRDAPAIIGALCDAVACALRRQETVRLGRLPRMADHAVWVEAAGPALGWGAGLYADDFMRSRDELVGSLVDDSPLGLAIERLVERNGAWTGTATELRAALAGIVEPSVTHGRAWPSTPRALTNAVARLAPALRARGYTVERTRTHGGVRVYLLGRVCKVPSPSSPHHQHAVANRPVSSDGVAQGGDAADTPCVTAASPCVTAASPHYRRVTSEDVLWHDAGDGGDGGDGTLHDFTNGGSPDVEAL